MRIASMVNNMVKDFGTMVHSSRCLLEVSLFITERERRGANLASDDQKHEY